MSATKCPPAVYESQCLEREKQTTKFCGFERNMKGTADSVKSDQHN